MKREAGSVKALCIFLNGVLISMLCMGLLSGCSENRKEETDAVAITEIERLSFSEQGSEAPVIVTTVLSREEKETCICFVTAEEEKYEYREDSMLMDQVQEIFETYEVGKWNGFGKSDPAVMDGTSFTLSVHFMDGTRLSAWGNNAFPEHYQEVSNALKELVQPIKERFLEEYAENDFVEKTVVDYEQIYESLLESYAQLILTGEPDDDMVEAGSRSVQSIADMYPASIAASMVGYRIQDMSGDEIPELLIGAVNELRDGKGYGTRVYAVYTCEEQMPVWSLGSYERTSYQLISGNRLFYQSSGGAADTCFGSGHLASDGRKVIFDDFYFSSAGTEEGAEICYYHNVSGDWDKEASKQLDSRSFWAMESKLYEQLEEAEFIPFSQYMDEHGMEIPEESAEEISVHAGWWDDTCAVFEANMPVQDFTVLTLNCEDFDENGIPIYSIADELNYGSMVPGEPMFVNVEPMGTIPTKGISYVDSRGMKRYYTIGEDGYDGALFLERINIY